MELLTPGGLEMGSIYVAIYVFTSTPNMELLFTEAQLFNDLKSRPKFKQKSELETNPSVLVKNNISTDVIKFVTNFGSDV